MSHRIFLAEDQEPFREGLTGQADLEAGGGTEGVFPEATRLIGLFDRGGGLGARAPPPCPAGTAQHVDPTNDGGATKLRRERLERRPSW